MSGNGHVTSTTHAKPVRSLLALLQLHAPLPGLADGAAVAEAVVVLAAEELVLAGDADRVCCGRAAVFHPFT